MLRQPVVFLSIRSSTRHIRTQPRYVGQASDPNVVFQSPLGLATPKQLVQYLDEFIVGQTTAKKVLSVAVYNHYNRVRGNLASLDLHHTILRHRRDFSPNDREEVDTNPMVVPSSANALLPHPYRLSPSGSTRQLGRQATSLFEKSNVLLIGPTGCGKSLLVRTLARVLDVPFSSNDATSFTQAGYVGDDVEMCIYRLLQASNWDSQRASAGIVYIDEVDKLARRGGGPLGSSDSTRDVGGEGVQQALLRMMEGGAITIHAKGQPWTTGDVTADDARKTGHGPNQEVYNVDTHNILFVCSGAFVGLEDIIKRRVAQGSIGFTAQLASHEAPADPIPFFSSNPANSPSYLDLVQPKDVVAFGFIPEFISRLPVLASLRSLDIPDLMRILTEVRGSLVSQYVALFGYSGVELRFTTAALRKICRAAMEHGGGARGLRGIMENLLLDAMYEVPGSSVRYVLVNERVAKKLEPALYWSRGEGAAFWATWADEESRSETTQL